MKVILRAAAGLVALAVLPVWPYGYYLVIRVVVFVVAIYIVVVGKPLASRDRALLGVLAVLFNPVFPVSLTRLVWLPIDLAASFYLWRLSNSPAVLSVPLPKR